MKLADIQKTFKDTMLDHPDAVHDPSDEFSALFNVGNIPLPERLKVYRNNIVGGLTDTLLISFPLVKKLVGEAFFKELARAFIPQNPPNEGCLNTYGQGLNTFIKTFKPAQSLPYLSDVARFEIALTNSYYAPDDKALTIEDLSKILPEDLSNMPLQLRKSTELLSSSYPLNAIREFCLREDQNNDEQLDLDQSGAPLMIYRPALEVLVVTLNKDEFEMLQNLENNPNLGSALEKTLEQHENFDFQGFLQKHIELETFCAFNTNV